MEVVPIHIISNPLEAGLNLKEKKKVLILHSKTFCHSLLPADHSILRPVRTTSSSSDTYRFAARLQGANSYVSFKILEYGTMMHGIGEFPWPVTLSAMS